VQRERHRLAVVSLTSADNFVPFGDLEFVDHNSYVTSRESVHQKSATPVNQPISLSFIHSVHCGASDQYRSGGGMVSDCVAQSSPEHVGGTGSAREVPVKIGNQRRLAARSHTSSANTCPFGHRHVIWSSGPGCCENRFDTPRGTSIHFVIRNHASGVSRVGGFLSGF